MDVPMKTKYVPLSVMLTAALALHSTFSRAAPNRSASKEVPGDGDPNKERRDWMNRGNAEYGQKNWEAARDAYRRSWDIKHHYTIAANLADVEMKMGHYAVAADYLKYVLANLPENKTADRKAAEEQLLECKNHLTVVRVTTDVDDATVRVDGRDMGQTPLREDVLLEPGKHVISVAKPGYGETTKEFSAEGSRVELSLTLEKASATPAAQPRANSATPPLPQTQPLSTRSHPKGYRIGSYVGFGIGAVGVGLGTFFWLKGRNRQLDADNQYAACFPHCSSAQKANINDLDQSAQHQRNAGAVSYIASGVGLITGVALLVLDSKKTHVESGAIARPWIGMDQAGLLGTF
jgi:tetratricopeptide (TPR) repeat protein